MSHGVSVVKRKSGWKIINSTRACVHYVLSSTCHTKKFSNEALWLRIKEFLECMLSCSKSSSFSDCALLALACTLFKRYWMKVAHFWSSVSLPDMSCMVSGLG